MFGIFKMIFLGIITLVIILWITIFNIGIGENPKDKMINTYDSFIQSFDTAGLTSNWKLKGKRKYGVDNSKIASIPETGGMKYEYTLDCYSENGKKKEIKFRTSRELKEDSYLKLEVMVTRGVKSWEEVQVNELPEKVKTALNVK